MQEQNHFQILDSVDKEESFDLSDMLSSEESLEENSISESSDSFAEITYNEPFKKQQKKPRKKIIKSKKLFKKHFSRFSGRKKLWKEQRCLSSNIKKS